MGYTGRCCTIDVITTDWRLLVETPRLSTRGFGLTTAATLPRLVGVCLWGCGGDRMIQLPTADCLRLSCLSPGPVTRSGRPVEGAVA